MDIIGKALKVMIREEVVKERLVDAQPGKNGLWEIIEGLQRGMQRLEEKIEELSAERGALRQQEEVVPAMQRQLGEEVRGVPPQSPTLIPQEEIEDEVATQIPIGDDEDEVATQIPIGYDEDEVAMLPMRDDGGAIRMSIGDDQAGVVTDTDDDVTQLHPPPHAEEEGPLRKKARVLPEFVRQSHALAKAACRIRCAQVAVGISR